MWTCIQYIDDTSFIGLDTNFVLAELITFQFHPAYFPQTPPPPPLLLIVPYYYSTFSIIADGLYSHSET